MSSTAFAPGSWMRRGLRLAGWATTLALVGFHARLFAGRLSDASLAQPEVQLRWALAAALLGLALLFRRRGLSLVRGRPAIVFWLLAVLLHLGPVPLPAMSEPINGLLAAVPWMFAVPLAVFLGRRLAALSASTAPARAGRRDAPRTPRSALFLSSPGFSPRPPPAA